MSISKIWGFLSNASGRMLPHSNREAASWEKLNSHRQQNRYGRRQRILNAGTDHPIRFAICVFLLSLLIATLFVLPYPSLVQEFALYVSQKVGTECSTSLSKLLNFDLDSIWNRLSSWLPSFDWFPSIHWTFPLLKKDDFDIAAFVGVPWTVQATLIALVYPIVLSFVGVLLQRNAQFGVMMRVYIIESGVMPSGASSIALLIFLGFQYFATPYFKAECNQLLFTATIFSDCIWLTINILLTSNYLTRTVHFLRDNERNLAFQRAAIDIALSGELKQITHRLHYMNAPERFGMRVSDSDNSPLVLMSFPAGGESQVTKVFKKKKILYDVRINILMSIAKRWYRRAKPGPNGERPMMSFNLSLDATYMGEIDLCRVSDGPFLKWYEKYVIKHAFIFRTARKATPKLSTTEMLSELASEIRILLDDRRTETAVQAITRLTSTHNLLLKSSSIVIAGEPQSTATLGTSPGSFNSTTLSNSWIRTYRDICIQAVNLINEDLSIFEKLAGANAAITKGVPMAPAQPHIDVQAVGTMLAYRLGKWWTEKIDETSLHGAQSFNGILPPLFDKIYDRALRHLIGQWGNLKIYFDKNEKFTDEEKWLNHSSRALVYAIHIENLASILLAAVSRRDVTASRRYLDSFQKWWGTRLYSLQPREVHLMTNKSFFTIQIANQSWPEAQTSLGSEEQPVAIDDACSSLSIAIQRYWESMRLYLLLQLIHNAGHRSDIDVHRLELAVAVAQGKGLFEGGKVSAKRLLSFDQMLNAILTECFGVSHESSRINAFAENDGSSRSRESDIQGWTYLWSGVPATIDSMRTAQALLLLTVSANRGNGLNESASLIEAWRDDIDQLQMIERHLKQLHGEISSREFIIENFRILGKLRKLFDSPQSRRSTIERAKTALLTLSEAARSAWIQKMQSLSIDEGLVEQHRIQFSESLFNIEHLPAFIHHLEFTNITGVAPTTYSYFENKRYLLMGVGNGIHSDTAESIAGYMRATIINQAMHAKFVSEGITFIGPQAVYDDVDASYEDRVSFLVALDAECNRLREAGHIPLIIGGMSSALSYLSPWTWNAEQSPLPDDISFSTAQLEDGRVPNYCLNDALIIESNTPSDKCYVVPETMFNNLKINGTNELDAVSLRYQETAPETLNMVFTCIAAF